MGSLMIFPAVVAGRFVELQSESVAQRPGLNPASRRGVGRAAAGKHGYVQSTGRASTVSGLELAPQHLDFVRSLIMPLDD